MKMELKIEGKVIVIEAEGVVSVSVREEASAVRPVVQKEKENVAVEPAAASVAGPVVVPAVAPAVLPPVAPSGLFEKLVGLRRELAAAGGVPPYVVFKDKTLQEMAEKCPSSLAEFGSISGVGQAKLEKYGAQFLAVIQEVAA
jgi:ATP-dependent DNA helicase RecQ